MSGISLALVTRNQASFLRVFLDNYYRHGAGRLPLLVVDDGSDDRTPQILSGLPAGFPITVHRIPHFSIAHARNLALHRSPTPWLAFSDTDCLLDAAYFETLMTIPRRFPDAAAVEGAVHTPKTTPPPFTHSVANLKGGFFATANMVFHVPSVLGLGGFDETHFGNFREDTDLALTLWEKKGPIPFCPELIVMHPFVARDLMSSLTHSWSRHNQIVAAEIALFRKHPETYAKVRHRRDARGTLLAWCRLHALSGVRASARHFRSRGVTLEGLRRALLALVSDSWDQVAILLICLTRPNDILGAKRAREAEASIW